MNASEYEKLEKIMNDGISSARQAKRIKITGPESFRIWGRD